MQGNIHGVTFNPELKTGYYDKNTLMTLKGFSDWQHFCVHYLVSANNDENGKTFFNCEKRGI